MILKGFCKPERESDFIRWYFSAPESVSLYLGIEAIWEIRSVAKWMGIKINTWSVNTTIIFFMYITCMLIVYYLFIPINAHTRAHTHIYIYIIILHTLHIYIYIYIYTYTEYPRRNGQNFGRVFLMLDYTDITQSWTVTEIMAREVGNFDSCYTLIYYQIHIKTGRNMWFL